MTQWVLDFAADARYQTFPFDRPYLDLYDRCIRIRRAADVFLRTPPEDSQVRKAIQRLCHILNPVSSEVPFATVAEKLRGRAELFDELRDTLRIVPRTAGKNQTPPAKPLPVEQAITELNDIQAALERLTALLQKRRSERGPAQDTREAIDLVLSHIEKHGESLWGHQITLPLHAGGGIRLVERTNNLLETLFHTIKQGERRRSGRKNLAHDLEHLPPEAALTLNLKSEDYVKILCGSLAKLPHAFAQLDSAQHNALAAAPRQPANDNSDTTTTPKIESASLPAVDRRLIRSQTMSRRNGARLHPQQGARQPQTDAVGF
jgi:hypothetical protein